MDRDGKIDGIKAVLILLMVLGHMSYSDGMTKCTHMIYSFHMPAFVFLSGYLTSVSSPSLKKLKWAIATVTIYLAAQWYQIGWEVLHRLCFTGTIAFPHWKEMVGIRPCFSLWYILSLVYWRTSIWLTHRRVADHWLICFSLCAMILSGCIPIGNQLSLQRTLVFMPMFVLGYLCKKHQLEISMRQYPRWLTVTVFSTGLIVSRFLPFFMPSSPYENILQDAALRCIQSGIGLILTYSFLQLMYAIPIQRFARWGRYTLWVYVGHTLPIMIQNFEVSKHHLKFNVIVAFGVAILYVVGFTIAAECYHRVLRRQAN